MSTKQTQHVVYEKKAAKQQLLKLKHDYHIRLLEIKTQYKDAKKSIKEDPSNNKSTAKLQAINDENLKLKKEALDWYQQQKVAIIKNNTYSLDDHQYDLNRAKLVTLITNPVFRFFKTWTLTKKQKEIYRDLNKKHLESLNTPKQNFNRNNIFEVDNFNFYYGSTQALFDINIKIKRKMVTAFIGPSGCGKSTFLRCLNRTNNGNVTTTGNIYFDDGTNILSKKLSPLSLRTRVGMIFQRPAPFPMSIYENVAYGPKSHGILNKELLDKIVKDALQSAALWDEVKDKLFTSATALSGGQQQRLCIARAIALKPEVLLMDESTSGLDPIATAKIENLINILKKDYTIILVSHSMAQVQRVADYTAFFYKGELVEYGATREIFFNPQNKKTRAYISGKIG